MVAVTIAVCGDHLSPQLEACLDALAAQGAAPIVALAGAARAQHALTDRSAGATLAESEPGIAQARNAALAAAGDADVVAFVETDIVVADGWLERLVAAWEEAPADRGTIGGPIAIRLDGARPSWLSDALLAAFAPLD